MGSMTTCVTPAWIGTKPRSQGPHGAYSSRVGSRARCGYTARAVGGTHDDVVRRRRCPHDDGVAIARRASRSQRDRDHSVIIIIMMMMGVGRRRGPVWWVGHRAGTDETRKGAIYKGGDTHTCAISNAYLSRGRTHFRTQTMCLLERAWRAPETAGQDMGFDIVPRTRASDCAQMRAKHLNTRFTKADR